MENTKIESNNNTIAIIAYLTLIGLIIAIVMNQEKKDPFASFHIRQSLGLGITGIVLGMIAIIPILGWLIYFVGIFVLLYMWVMGLINAINGKEKTLPILGDKYAEWLSGVA